MVIKKQKFSLISINQKIDYKDIDLLKLFITEQGKILHLRATGVTVQQQRRIAKAMKRARILSLLPFVASTSISSLWPPLPYLCRSSFQLVFSHAN